MTTEPSRRFPIGLTIAAAIAFTILIGLGVWQVKRLAWKEALLARIAALQAAPARPLAGALVDMAAGGDADFTRVIVQCPGLAKKPFLELYAVREGEAGLRLISACKVAEGGYDAILVDRGFVSGSVSARPPVDAADATPFTLTGVLRRPDKPTFVTPPNEVAKNHWYWRDAKAMAQALGAARPAPQVLMAETPTNPNWPALVPAPVPAEIPNRHLEYALTWFGLAAALAGVYAALLWRKWKG
ncbi:SURF1 family protein [Phenylobacterium aquaticum]|uniref:SURF1 family protein n=1 Tax=Phenylobacterium aquaticum TaxID=1763816 RepID=UPI0026EC4DFD|nr:SURF1 family protein [Phenylobacterium aquaticum]